MLKLFSKVAATFVVALLSLPAFSQSAFELSLKGVSLPEAKQSFTTVIINEGDKHELDIPPTDSDFEIIYFDSPVGKLPAYLTKAPKIQKKLPAIVWLTGGDSNTIGDVWSTRPKSNNQSASAFREQGMVMMFPSMRGGNSNPGKREGFYGEVDDILAATDYLASLPYVDSSQIYLGGHSTGGTLALLVAESTNRYRAVFSLGPVASPLQYGGTFLYCDTENEDEIVLRTPAYWLNSIKTPTYVLEGAKDGNWDVIEWMKARNTNALVHFKRMAGHDHFSLIEPVTKRIAEQITTGTLHSDIDKMVSY